jgi:hypothetical protein
MKTIWLNEYGQVEDSTIAESMAYIEKPFRETPVTGFKRLFTSKTRQIIKWEKLGEEYLDKMKKEKEAEITKFRFQYEKEMWRYVSFILKILNNIIQERVRFYNEGNYNEEFKMQIESRKPFMDHRQVLEPTLDENVKIDFLKKDLIEADAYLEYSIKQQLKKIQDLDCKGYLEETLEKLQNYIELYMFNTINVTKNRWFAENAYLEYSRKQLLEKIQDWDYKGYLEETLDKLQNSFIVSYLEKTEYSTFIGCMEGMIKWMQIWIKHWLSQSYWYIEDKDLTSDQKNNLGREYYFISRIRENMIDELVIEEKAKIGDLLTPKIERNKQLREKEIQEMEQIIKEIDPEMSIDDILKDKFLFNYNTREDFISFLKINKEKRDLKIMVNKKLKEIL